MPFRPLPVLLLALGPLAAEAETLSTTWTPRNARESEALSAGMALYGLRTAVRNGGLIRQAGRDNLAVLSQSGTGNQGAIIQRGRDHSATLTQTGSGNAHAIIQLGRGAEAEVSQTGGEAGVTVQLGLPDRKGPA